MLSGLESRPALIAYFDWIVGISTIVSLILLRYKKWYGWCLTLLNNAILFPILNIHVHNYGLLPLDAVTVYISVVGAISWRNENRMRASGS
jgi:hypothetical protein